MMKRKIAMMMALAIVGTSIYAVPVKAETTATTAAAATNIAVTAAEKGSDQYVINSMHGRAGATSPTGAKGIAFEAKYCMKENIKNIGKGVKTEYTKNSTAQTVDVVKKTTKDCKKVVERYQCKDTPASAKNVIKQVESGKYNSAQLVGTTESANAYNAEAAKKGITKVMQDSGISTKETQRIAEKALGKQTIKSAAQSASKAGAIGAVLGGGVALVESISNGDDFADTTGNVAYSSIESYASGAVASLAGDAATTIIVIAGGSSTVTVLIPIAVAAGAGIITYMVFENVDENYDIRAMIADAADYVKNGTIEFVDEAKIVIPLMASDAKDATCEAISEAKVVVPLMASDAKDATCKALSEAKEVVPLMASDAKDATCEWMVAAADHIENAAGVVTVKAAEIKDNIVK